MCKIDFAAEVIKISKNRHANSSQHHHKVSTCTAKQKLKRLIKIQIPQMGMKYNFNDSNLSM
jgi:hypothetical protein